MNQTKALGPSLRSLAATIWAGLLVIIGLAVAVDGPGPLPVSRQLFFFLGVAAIAGGQFVFMVLVADQLLRGARRSLIVFLEALTLGVCVTGVISTVALFAMGTGL
jgi:hypothetical protein